MADKKTREKWLNQAVKHLTVLFTKHDFKVPGAIRVSVGFPYRAKGTAIGQAWHTKCSADKHCELFISPSVDDPGKVLGILLHEMVHAVVGTEAGHKAPFKRCALLVGLAGKMTATHAGEELVVKLTGIATKLGAYPHARLTPGLEIKKQTTRLIKMQCMACGCIIRTTDKWLDLYPTPWDCPCGGELICPDEEE